MAIHHRTGQFKEVVRLAGREKLIYAGAVGQPRVSHWVKGLRVLAFAHLAMTYQSLGNKKQARQTLTSAEDLQQEIIAIRESGNFRKSDLPPERFLEAELLLAEARDMVDEHE